MKQVELNDYTSPEVYVPDEELHSHHLIFINLQGKGPGRVRRQNEAIFGISS